MLHQARIVVRFKSECAINRTNMARMNSYLRRPTLPTPTKTVGKTSGFNERFINEIMHIKHIGIYKRKPGNPNTMDKANGTEFRTHRY